MSTPRVILTGVHVDQDLIAAPSPGDPHATIPGEKRLRLEVAGLGTSQPYIDTLTALVGSTVELHRVSPT